MRNLNVKNITKKHVRAKRKEKTIEKSAKRRESQTTMRRGLRFCFARTETMQRAAQQNVAEALDVQIRMMPEILGNLVLEDYNSY